MPTTFYDQSKYRSVRAELTRKSDDFFHQYIMVSSILVKHWTKFLSTPELLVMQFVLGRTLLFRKRAESISKSQMATGIPGVCGPCGLSRNTIDKAVSALSERNYLILHAFKQDGREQNSRIYELNIARLLAEHDIEEVGNMASRLAKARTKPTPADGVPLPQRVGGLTIPTSVGINSTTNVVDSAVKLPTPRSGRRKVAINCNSGMTPAQLAMNIAAQATAKRDARARGATSLSTKRWATADLQALLDKAAESVRETGYKVPRVVVVAKNIGVLHKRLVAAGITNALDFFTWALQNWNTISSANRRSKAKQQEETQKATSAAMLNVPNFNDLAFRAPYIIAFYNQREHEKDVERAAEDNKAAEVARTDAATKRLIAGQKEKARLLDLQREEERKMERLRPLKPIRRTRTRVAETDDIPEFKESSWQ